MEDNKKITNGIVKNEDENSENNEHFTNENVKYFGTGNNPKSIEQGKKNLKPLNTRSIEEQKEIARKGGLKSGEVRKARKTASELLTKILTTNLTDEQIEEVLGNASTLLNGDKTSYNVMLVKALQMAMSGDTKALQFVRDSVGDMPTAKQEIQAQISDADKQLIDTVRNRLLG